MKFSRLFSVLLATLLLAVSVYADELMPEQNKKGKWGYVNQNGKKVINYQFDEASGFVDGRAKVCKGGKWGYIDQHGKEVIKLKYTEMGTWDKNRCKVAEGGSVKEGVLTGAKYGIINKIGEYVLKPEFDEIGPFKDGFAFVKKGNKCGYINERYDEVIPCKFTSIGSFNEQGLCWVLDGQKYGVYNNRGGVIVPAKYKYLGTYNTDFAEANPLFAKMTRNPEALDRLKRMAKDVAKKAGKSGFKKGFMAGLTGQKVDMTGEIAKAHDELNEDLQADLKEIYDAALTPEEKLIMAECGSFDLLSYSFISGRQFEKLDMSRSDYFAVSNSKVISDIITPRTTIDAMRSDKVGIYDKRGREILQAGKYDVALSPAEGHVPVANFKKDKLMVNYFKISSENVIFKKWLEATTLTPFVDGVAIIADDEDQYLVNRSGNRMSDDYTIICPPRNGIYIVGGSRGYGLLDDRGKQILKPSFSLILPQVDDLFCVRQNDKGKFGYINANGEFAIPEIYDEARSFSHGHAPVKNADGWGVISPKNQTLVEFSWDEVMDITNPDPEKVWVRKDTQWHALNIADNTSAFQTTFKPTGNFTADGYAPVCNENKFGLINTIGELVIPIGLSHESLLEKCISDMKERGISSLKPIDVYRYNITVNPQRNMFRLLDRVDDEMWDF